MSSAQAAWSQIGPREKYLIGIMDASSNGAVYVTDVSCIGFYQPLDPGNPVAGGRVYRNTVVDLSASDISMNGFAITQGTLYRDMGQEIVVTNTTDVYLSRFRLGNKVSGASTEGVQGPAAANVWLKTWSAAGGGVAVARTG